MKKTYKRSCREGPQIPVNKERVMVGWNIKRDIGKCIAQISRLYGTTLMKILCENTEIGSTKPIAKEKVQQENYTVA